MGSSVTIFLAVKIVTLLLVRSVGATAGGNDADAGNDGSGASATMAGFGCAVTPPARPRSNGNRTKDFFMAVPFQRDL